VSRLINVSGSVSKHWLAGLLSKHGLNDLLLQCMGDASNAPAMHGNIAQAMSLRIPASWFWS
jgi:hypothetical protein